MTGEIAIGRYVLQAGESSGAVLREARRAERAHFRPRPAPVMMRPRLLRGLVDRRTETEAALSALDAGLPVEVSGPPGIGKTALLRHLAHHPRTASFVDGIVYLSARQRTSIDLLQRIFEAFYEGDTICKPAHAEIRHALQDKHALILLDDVNVPQNELEEVLDCAPRSAFVVAGHDRSLWGEVRTIALTGLPAEDGAQLLERELERSLDAGEQAAAAELCAALEGYPRRILQAAADIRRNNVPADGWSRYATADGLVAELMTSIDDRERRILLALSALSGIGIDARHVSGLAELTDVEATLTGLVERGLVLNGQARYRLADGVADRLRRTGDPVPWVHRAVTYFTAWAERQRRSRESLLDASDALLRAQQHATDTRRWGEALRVGRLLEGTLVLSARWGAWEIALDRSLAAAKALGDRAVEAWVLHQMGTRAVSLGDEGHARRLLTQSATLRQELGEHAAAAISRRNLAFVPAAVVVPVVVPEPAAVPPPVVAQPAVAQPIVVAEPAAVAVVARDVAAPVMAAAAPAFDALPFRSDVAPVIVSQRKSSAGAMIAMFVACAILGGLTFAVVFNVPFPSLRGAAGQTAARATAPATLRETTEVVTHRTPDAPLPGPQRANILIFTARPGSIATRGPTSLCYAVSDAAQARIEPGIGQVDPASTLTCRRVTPLRTTTYELSATGRDGVPVSQSVVIVVR
jgi:hypothetical protein